MSKVNDRKKHTYRRQTHALTCIEDVNKYKEEVGGDTHISVDNNQTEAEKQMPKYTN